MIPSTHLANGFSLNEAREFWQMGWEFGTEKIQQYV